MSEKKDEIEKDIDEPFDSGDGDPVDGVADAALRAAKSALGDDADTSGASGGDDGGDAGDMDSDASGGDGEGDGADGDTPKDNHDPIDLLSGQLGMSREEVEEVIRVLAEARKAPDRAAEKLEEKAREIKREAGIDLPEDLKEKVENGLLDEEDAREIAQARVLRQRYEEAQRTLAVQAASAAVSSWEAAKRANDADFDVFAQPLFEFTQNIVAPSVIEGRMTADDAVRALEREYERLRSIAKAVAQKTRPRRPRVTSDGEGKSDAKKRSTEDMLIEKVAAILSGEGG